MYQLQTVGQDERVRSIAGPRNHELISGNRNEPFSFRTIPLLPGEQYFLHILWSERGRQLELVVSGNVQERLREHR